MQITKTKLFFAFYKFQSLSHVCETFIFLVATYLQPLNLNASLSWMSHFFFSIAQDKVSFESTLPVLPLHSFDDVGFILLETLLFSLFTSHIIGYVYFLLLQYLQLCRGRYLIVDTKQIPAMQKLFSRLLMGNACIPRKING